MDTVEGIKAVSSVILLLLGFVLVLFLAYWVTKMLGKHYGTGAGSSHYIQVVDRLFLGQDQWLYIVRVAGETLLLGVTPKGISQLTRLEETKLIAQAPENTGVMPFAELLKNIRLKKEKGEPKDESS